MTDFLKKFRADHHEFVYGNFEDITGGNPFELFQIWFDEAQEAEEKESNAFVLSTVSSELQPSSRIVYLKEVADEQFVFFTNYNSQKGKEIAENSKVSMLFFWPLLSRQIRIDGVCTKASNKISDDYFNSRPRGSQVGAWASHQSDVLENRKELENRVVEIEKQFPNNIPRPEHWGGYQINPTHIEFWQGRPSRLHDRLSLTKENGEWTAKRKNP
jgi:pyridoxamine 5'-phosphate oxidase